ncbi:MAG: hypothetical protein FWE71_05515 [Nocardioidaceae bacterium]|nr:hypothetical protein [Nocardioidaceae bacterium]MCL2611998.1 hypothetical protein [Nocardioidaceae bacterium]
MSTKAERRAAREKVATYHEEQLGRLVGRLADALDRHRAAELDAFDVDEVAFQYSRAAKELWKFCNLGNVEFTARIIDDDPPTDWWERGARRQR